MTPHWLVGAAGGLGMAAAAWLLDPVLLRFAKRELVAMGDGEHLEASAGPDEPAKDRAPWCALTGGVGFAVGLWAPAPPDASLLLGFSLWLYAIARVDFRYQIIPDRLSLPLIWAGMVASALAPALMRISAAESVLGAAGGYVVPWAAAIVASRITRRDAAGGGDLKLFAAIGAWVGVKALLPVLAAAIGLQLVCHVLTRRREVPAAPAICAAGIGGALVNFLQ